MSDQDDPVDRDTAKLWTAHRELAVVVWGDDRTRDNGIRSVVKKHEERIEALEEDQRKLRGELRHYLDKERPETCYGLAALARHEEESYTLLDETKEEETEVKVAEIGAAAAVSAARETGKAQVAREWVVVGGMALLVLKDFILPLVGAAK